MLRTLTAISLLFLSSAFARAQPGVQQFNVDLAASGLLPVTWASDSPALVHLGFDLKFGLEYDSAISVPVRLEIGYIRSSASRVSRLGELYKAWEGLRVDLLSGYDFAPRPIGRWGSLVFGILGGGAITAADYSSTALAYAYPSLILEPRVALNQRVGKGSAQGPWLAAPMELMFRAGTRTLAPGLGLGWRYRLGAAF